MNWKSRFTELKVGDTIEVVKKSPKCNNCSFAECKKRLNGTTIDSIKSTNRYGDVGISYSVNGNNYNSHCFIPKECVRKVTK